MCGNPGSRLDQPVAPARHRLGADVGGTFTDLVMRTAQGALTVRKVPSTSPNYDRGVVSGASELLRDVGARQGLGQVLHATTVATNAVLERRGARAALVTTAGFRDVLELRRVRIPHTYDPLWRKPRPLVERALRFEIGERVTATGEVLAPVDPAEVRRVAESLRRERVEAVAVCLIHAHRHPAHEQVVARILRHELPDIPICISSELRREQQEYERTAATALNAYVIPLMSAYIQDLEAGLARLAQSPVDLRVMQSSGGLATADNVMVRPVTALESGPAAGVVGAQGHARALGVDNVIAFDMGGTTAKASLIEGGRISRSREYEVGASLSAGSRLLRGSGDLIRIPTIDIAEIGAGGGSIAWLDDAGGLRVGPHSAGADPGPVCYRRGGSSPTVTDANVVLGYMPAGPLGDGEIEVSRSAAVESVQRIGDELGMDAQETALSIRELALAAMIKAIRSISSERGRDPADFSLMAYGGSGPLHACAIADELGIDDVIVPPLAGLLSATGLLFARTEMHDVRFCEMSATEPDFERLAVLEGEMRVALERDFGDVPTTWSRSADVRYAGESWDLEIAWPGGGHDRTAVRRLVDAFRLEHARQYGVDSEAERMVEIRAIRLSARGDVQDGSAAAEIAVPPRPGSRTSQATRFEPDEIAVRVLGRAELSSEPLTGPCLVDEYDTTFVVPPGWELVRGEENTIRARRVANVSVRPSRSAVARQLVESALTSTADEMATTIFRTAHSTVVRDVMDFSAALCDENGQTIAQALTLPLHLGSIPTAMQSLLSSRRDRIKPGDVYMMNDPFSGGMHTSDIFVAAPVHVGGERVGFAVAVAHHADVGGRVPGTTACDNTDIYSEGVRFPWVPVLEEGRRADDLLAVLATNVRAPDVTNADLNAQIAACNVGRDGLQRICGRYGVRSFRRLLVDLLDHTEAMVRAELETWPATTARFTDFMDSNGIEERDVAISASVTTRGSDVMVDFSDSSPMVPGALNATHSYAQASAYHAVLSALSQDIPQTAGAFRPIEVVTRPGTVTHVVSPGASSMRGVTGFRMYDAVNGALAQIVPERVSAAGEGGNTVAVFSGARPDGRPFILYELVVGTWGAQPNGDGNDGLSNPCATAANIPIETAEAEFPILIERYGFVRDSGGSGRFRGGLAIERAWRPLVPVTLQVRSDRQRHGPYGLAHGDKGARGKNLVLSGGDRPERRPAMFSGRLDAGQTFVHRMAGGGGWGPAAERDPESVAHDVRDDKVSREYAATSYHVVITASGSLDLQATASLRAQPNREPIETEPTRTVAR